MSADYGPRELQRDTNVSRETLEKLGLYAELLAKWGNALNLVGKTTLNALWHRHFLDSLQLAPLIRNHGTAEPICLDMGTGAGFPGMVLALANVGHWTLVESDQRKVGFLTELSRIAEVSVTLRAERVEAMDPFPADIITARALAPLERLMAYAKPFVNHNSLCLFPKGKGYARDVGEAEVKWGFAPELCASQSDPEGRIVMIKGEFHER